MKNIYEIIGSVQRKISVYLGLSALIALIFVVAFEIKLSTEITVRMVGADQTAFIPGLDEAILFNDSEGQDLILRWLLQRHQLLGATVSTQQPKCDFLTVKSDFFDICWSVKKYVTAYHRMHGGKFLEVKSPIRFDFDMVSYPIVLLILGVFALFSLVIRSIFRNLARSVHEPIVSLASSVVNGTTINIQQNLSELRTLATTLVSVREIERQRAINDVSQSLTHDLKNELGTFEFLSRIDSYPEFQTWKVEAQGALARAWSIIGKIGVTSAEQTLEKVPCRLDLARTVRDAQRNDDHVKINVESYWLAEEVLFTIDPVAIDRLILNLIKNSVESGAANITMIGRIDGLDLSISVVDDGPGVPQSIIGRLFNRGESYGKRDGHGLGLYNVKIIAEGHGGQVTYSRQGAESVFEVILPGCVTQTLPSPSDGSPLITDELSYKNTLLVVIKDLERQQAILHHLAKYPVKIQLSESDSVLPSIVLTDDHTLVDRYLAGHIPIVMDNGKDDPERIAKQLVRRFRAVSDIKNKRNHT